MQPSKIADVATGTAWTLWGVSLAQINEALQAVALLLTIVATTITIGIHLRRWFERNGWISK